MGSNDVGSNDEIVCKIAFWFYRRMALIFVLLTLGGLWFLYDGAVGWPKKNVVALAKESFEAGRDGVDWTEFSTTGESFVDAGISDEDALGLIKEAHAEGAKPLPWKEFALSPGGEDALGVSDEAVLKQAFAAGADPANAWEEYAAANGIPASKAEAEADTAHGIDGFVALKSAFDGARKKREWAIYGPLTERKGWGGKDPHYHSKSEIKGQFGFAYALWALAAVALVWIVMNSRRVLRSDADSLTTDKGVRVPFAEVFRIDKRKWDNKGLAYAYYRTESGSEKRAVIDVLKYKDADRVFDRLMENFEGELVERVSAEDSEAPAGEAIEGEQDSVIDEGEGAGP